MKQAVEVFPVSEEEAEDIDKLRDTFPDKADLRAVLEDYFHIYDDYAKMSAQEFDMYFEDYMKDYEEPEFVEDIPLNNSWKQFHKGDKLEKRENLKEIYEQAHWEYLTDIRDDLKGEDLKDALSEIHFIFDGISDLKSFLLECAKENLPGAKEKLRKLNSMIGSASARKPIESGRVEHYRDAYLGGLMSREDFKKNLLEEGYDDELADYLIDKMCRNSIACSKKTVVESLIKSGYSKKEAEDIYEKSRV